MEIKGDVMKSKLLKKFITLTIIGATLLTTLPIGASAEWRSNNVGWSYSQGTSYSIGWKLIDNSWYYFDSNGYMAHNTIVDGYYIESNGTAVATSSVGIPIKVPANWTKLDMKVAGIDLSYNMNNKSAFIYSTKDLPAGCSESIFMSGVKAGLSSKQSDVQVSEKNYNGKKAFCAEYVYTQNSQTLKNYMVFIFNNNKAYVFGISSNLDSFDNNKRELEDLLNLSLAF